MTDEPKFTGPVRSDAVYLSWQSRTGLNYIARAQGITTDELADTILADWLKANHLEVVEHMKARTESDNEFRKTLEKQLKPKAPF